MECKILYFIPPYFNILNFNTISQNMKTSIKHLIFIIFIGFSFSLALHAQDNPKSSIHKQWNVKLSNSFNPKFHLLNSDPNDGKSPFYIGLANFRTEINYGLLSCLQIGGYFGYSWEGYSRGGVGTGNDIEWFKEPAYAINYGAQLNFHPLDLLLNRNLNGVDVWLSGKFGQASEHSYSILHNEKRWQSFTEYGFGAGIAIFPFKQKRLGLYFEFSAGDWLLKTKKLNTDGMGQFDFRWGVSYKFGK
jgi:hypothetical protein